jgi:bifunctional non-homologous end joining protein LigD
MSVSKPAAKKSATASRGGLVKGALTKKGQEYKVGTSNVILTNLEKIYWPEEGYTKGDMINYYNSMADYILPYLKSRPLSLKRNPNGINAPSFFHKNAGENVPSFVDVFPVKNETDGRVIDYILCNNKATLLYVANLGSIEMNPWNSTTKKIGNPTWMVIDIDPSSKNSFADVVDAALATKMVLDKAGIKSYCKTSGSSGLHVYVPLKNKYDYETVKSFAEVVAHLVTEQLPETTTLERSLSKRGPRIYMDYLQNRIGQTLATVYSLRPVPGASASCPLEWKEVNHKLHPSQFNINNMLKRVEKKGDLFAPVLSTGESIEKALKKL